ncbi:hypothetical protein D0T50_10125 [Bacteroides sp. 214]|uniref:hypothetical protein n=1 Tax=Bacteroides sp. 214 TaxID=2302935 RepID=UPI0013D490E1|nr:hypothetical protein [Bacteroides sp. 214]NDW13251.1 hypothetical protein [Bacteroides sp. 214]
MVKIKQIICVLLLAVLSGTVFAQNNTNSPYTRYGYGQLSDQGFGNSKAMGGLAVGVRDRLHINPTNPASYTAIDSLTFLFDMGFTLQNTNFSDGTTKINAKNSSFDYVAMQFRLRRGLAFTLGLLPYSNVGYNLQQSITDSEDATGNHVISYYGDGGLHQVLAGVGMNLFKGFSVGANASFLWGEISKTRSVIFSSTTSGANSFVEETNTNIRDVKFDFGAQYEHRFNKKNKIIVGATFTPKNSLNNDTYVSTVSSTTVQKDTIATFETPNSFAIGFTYKYDERLMVGIDYALQQWGDATYMDAKKSFCDYSKISLGVEYLPSFVGRSFFSSLKYRAGAYVSSPYYKAQGDGGETFRAAKEFGVSAGVAIPLIRSRSIINLSAQYAKVTGQRNNLLDEKYLRINIGITFNERWFAKLKVH